MLVSAEFFHKPVHSIFNLIGVTVHEDSGERHVVKSTFVILIPAQAQQHATVYIMDLNVSYLKYIKNL